MEVCPSQAGFTLRHVRTAGAVWPIVASANLIVQRFALVRITLGAAQRFVYADATLDDSKFGRALSVEY